MAVVLVHGVPETDAVWRPLLGELGRDDVTCLSPPGFGAPVPDGFGATYLEYRDWLIGELEQFGGPVDLVGHDWGGGHVMNAVMSRPDLARSWVTDVIGLFHPDYVWHELAQGWQQPEVGEKLVDAMVNGPVQERLSRWQGFGISREVAEGMIAGQNEEMGRCILALYRSAVQPALRELGEYLPSAAARPGLVLLATEDNVVGTDEMRRQAAARANAQVAVLDGLGHWWMAQDPARAAQVLTEFWASVPG